MKSSDGCLIVEDRCDYSRTSAVYKRVGTEMPSQPSRSSWWKLMARSELSEFQYHSDVCYK